MIVTEAQALTLRCCGPEGCGDGTRETMNAPYLRRCIASACMAWRWATTYAGKPDGSFYGGSPRDSVTSGFCGYAGG